MLISILPAAEAAAFGPAPPRRTPYVPGAQADVDFADVVIGDAVVGSPVGKLTSAAALIAARPGILPRGTVLGQVYAPAVPPTVVASPTNAGNGTVSDLEIGSTPIFLTLVAGVGSVNPGDDFVTPGSSNVFTVYARQDNVTPPLGLAFVGEPFKVDEVSFLITQGTVPFAVGDMFEINSPVSNGSAGLFTPCVATASDGSQVPTAILADDTDTSGQIMSRVYPSGVFRAEGLWFDSSWTINDLTTALAASNMIVRSGF